MQEIILGISVFTGVVVALVLIILFAKSKVALAEHSLVE